MTAGRPPFDELIMRELATKAGLDTEGLKKIAEYPGTVNWAWLAAVHELGFADGEIRNVAAYVLKGLVVAERGSGFHIHKVQRIR